MPKTRLQNIIFTLIMAFVMVYAMVCYNIALEGRNDQRDLPVSVPRDSHYVAHCLHSGVFRSGKAVPEAGIPHGIPGG